MTLLAFFVSPLTALLTAAGAASIPILIHLLNRNRFRVVTWAAMRFLLAAQRKNTRRMRIEQLILLAVRTLVVLLMVAAMASVTGWAEEIWNRFFPDHAVYAPAGSRRTHKIIVLDGSLSMARRVPEGTCFDRARAMAQAVVSDGMGGDGYSVILMSAPPRAIVTDPSDDARKVAEEIQNLRLPHGNADFAATLSAVENILARSPGKFEEREVYFITDMQRATWTARQAINPMLALQKIQGQARSILLDVGAGDDFHNLAVTSLTLDLEKKPLATTGSETVFRANIHNYGPRPREDVRIELLVGRARTIAADAPFDMRVVAERIEDISPGQTKTISFKHKFAAAGEHAVQVRLESDDLELDNLRTVIVAVKDSVPVMLVNGKPAVEPFDRATEFLRHALNPYQKGQAPRDIPARPKVVSESQFADAGVGDLTPFDCVFLCDVPRLSVSEVRRLEAHLRRGGGVIFCMGPHVDRDEYNRLLHRGGKGILPAALKEVRQAPDKQPFLFYADEESYKKAPLDAFAADNDRTSLLYARFRQYVITEPNERVSRVLSFMEEKTDVRPEATEKTKGGDAAILAWNPPIVADNQARPDKSKTSAARGRVILLTTSVNMDWTSWPISPSFPPMMQELLRYAIAGRLREQAIVVGETLEEFLPLSGARLDVVVHTPDGRVDAARTEDREDAGLLRYADTDTSGIYRAVIGNHPQDHLFAVNIPVATDAQQACESDLSRTNRDEMTSAYPGWEFQVQTQLSDVSHAGVVAGEGPQRIVGGMGMTAARYLLLGMLGLLLIEVLLAWWFGHYSAAGGAAATGTEGTPSQVAAWYARLGPAALLLFCAALGGVLLHAVWTGDFLGFLPDEFRRAAESALGVPAPAPGEGTYWRLEFMPYLHSAAADPWIAGTIALACAFLVFAIYFREGSTANAAYKVLLGTLRLGFILLALAVLLPQLRLWFERQGWPDVAVIIDDSRSMSATDRYQDQDVREAAERLAQLTSLAEPERLQLAQALLTGNQPTLLENLLLERKVKIHLYRCSARATRIADVTDPNEPLQREEAIQAIRDLRAEGESSQLGAAIRQVLNDFRGSSLAAVVMLTDGVTTDGEDLVKVSRYAAQVGVPLFFIGIGDSHETRDLQLHDLQVEDTVYVNDRLVFEARLTGQGYTDLSVPVTLREKGKEKVLARQMVRVDPRGKPVKFRLTHQPTEPGEKTYVIEVPVQPDELQPADNNQLERTVFVREAKLIKVLYVEGYARYEYRYIKHLLERESDADPRNKTMDLKVLLLDAADEYARQDKSALSEFPAKVELQQYDVIILGDADPRHPKLGEKNLSELAGFVRERGGGLLMIAGERHSPHAYRDTPLKDVLPVEPSIPEQDEVDRTEGYRLELTPVGRFHPIFRFAPDEAENTTIWKQLPELYWWSEGYRTKPAAEVLALHPRAKAEAPPGGGDSKEMHPLIVQQFVGAGRCLFYGMNETWRWRFREHEIRFNQFWIQTIRYLARSRLGRVELRLDRQTPYRRGEPIKITVRFPDDTPPPPAGTKVKVSVVRSLPRSQGQGEIEKWELELEEVKGYRATYETLFTQTPEGDYRFWLSTPAVTPKPKAECRVVVPPGEMDRLRMNREDMSRAAEESQGRFYTLADADRLLEDLPSGTRVALNAPQPPQVIWNHPFMVVLALGLLGTEWFMRKRKHLL